MHNTLHFRTSEDVVCISFLRRVKLSMSYYLHFIRCAVPEMYYLRILYLLYLPLFLPHLPLRQGTWAWAGGDLACREEALDRGTRASGNGSLDAGSLYDVSEFHTIQYVFNVFVLINIYIYCLLLLSSTSNHFWL